MKELQALKDKLVEMEKEQWNLRECCDDYQYKLEVAEKAHKEKHESMIAMMNECLGYRKAMEEIRGNVFKHMVSDDVAKIIDEALTQSYLEKHKKKITSS